MNVKVMLLRAERPGRGGGISGTGRTGGTGCPAPGAMPGDHARRTPAAAPRTAPSNLTICRRQPVPVPQFSSGICGCCHARSVSDNHTHADFPGLEP